MPDWSGAWRIRERGVVILAALEGVLREVARQHHFNASGHTLIIRGVCAECNRARPNKRRLDLI